MVGVEPTRACAHSILSVACPALKIADEFYTIAPREGVGVSSLILRQAQDKWLLSGLAA